LHFEDLRRSKVGAPFSLPIGTDDEPAVAAIRFGSSCKSCEATESWSSSGGASGKSGDVLNVVTTSWGDTSMRSK